MATAASAGHGGLSDAALKEALSEASLIVHAPPDIPLDAEIVGVCAVDEIHAVPNGLGWIAADFMAWKALFHEVGDSHHQHWFSTLNIKKFSKDSSGLDLENGSNGDKILGKHRDEIAGLPANNALFVPAFLDMVATRARVAHKRKTSLFIMCFAPVTAEQTIVVDFGVDAKQYIPVDWIRVVIRDAVGEDLPVVLLTPSALTGGWMCRPTLFPKQIAGATSDSVRRTIAKTCGGIFADSCVKVFTTRDTPLLTSEQRTHVKYHDMMPVGPTDHQIMRLHLFQRGIHEALERRACALAKSHRFDFNPATDAWTALAPRRYRSLVQFWSNFKKWEQTWAVDDVDRFAFLGEAHGGTRTSQVFWLKYLTSIELETCYGDWGKGVTGPTPTYFQNFIRDNEPTDSIFKRVFDTVEFRSSSMAFAHIVVNALNLGTPGVDCRFWIDEDGQNNEGYSLMRTSFSGILNLLDHPAVFPGEIRHDYSYIRFYRASRWIAAAMAINFLKLTAPTTHIRPFIDNKIAPLINDIRNTQYSILKEDARLRDLGVKWLKALNLGINLPDVERPVGALWSPGAQTETEKDVEVPMFQAPTATPVRFAALPSAEYRFTPTIPAFSQPNRQASFDTPSQLNVNAKPYVPAQQQDAGRPKMDMSAAKRMIIRQIGNPVETKPVRISAPASIPVQPDVAVDAVPVEAENAQSGVSVEAQPQLDVATETQPDVSVEVAAVDSEMSTKTEEAHPEVPVEVAAVDLEVPTKAEETQPAVSVEVAGTLATPGNLDPGYDAFFGAADNFKNKFNAKVQAEKARAEEPETIEGPVLGYWNDPVPKVDAAEKEATAHHWNDCATRVDDVEKMATADDDLKDLLAKDWTKKAEIREKIRQAHVYQPMQSDNAERLEGILNSKVAPSPVQTSTSTPPIVEADGAESAVGETVESVDFQDKAAEEHDDDVSIKQEDVESDTPALHSIPALDSSGETEATADSSDQATDIATVLQALSAADQAKVLALLESFRTGAAATTAAAHTSVDTEDASTTGMSPPRSPVDESLNAASHQMDDHGSSAQGSDKADETEDLDSFVSLNTAPENTFLTEISDKAHDAPEAVEVPEVPEVPEAPEAPAVSATPAAPVASGTTGLLEGNDFWSKAGW